MEVLVVGGTGTVGREVTRQLARRGNAVRVLSRSPERLADLPAGARGGRGDLRDPASLREAFAGAEGVFLLTPLAQEETDQGLAGVAAAREAGPKLVVHMSVAMPPGSEHVPHFASKIPIERELRRSGLAWAILRPNHFYQNDLWLRDAILGGLYPQPLSRKGVSRVDVRDIAECAVNALTKPGFAGREYPVHGPEPLTGPEVAATWSRHLGREVRYAGGDLDAWERGARQALPEWLVRDLRIMYAYFAEHGFRAGAAELEEQQKILGHRPRTFDAFVQETAERWRAEEAPP